MNDWEEHEKIMEELDPQPTLASLDEKLNGIEWMLGYLMIYHDRDFPLSKEDVDKINYAHDLIGDVFRIIDDPTVNE